MKSIPLFVGLAVALSATGTIAQVRWDTQVPPNPEKMRAFFDYFTKKLPVELKICETNNKQFTEGVAAETLAAAKQAGRKSEQEELNKKGAALIREAAVHARVTCLTQFYWTLRSAYDLSSVASWRYNAIELMLTDDLTEAAIRGVGSRVRLRSDQWQQEVLFKPAQDFSRILQPSKKNGTADNTVGDLLRMTLRNDFQELYGMFFSDMRNAPNGFRSFGCEWIDGDLSPIRCN